jgi:hypothetical protein
MRGPICGLLTLAAAAGLGLQAGGQLAGRAVPVTGTAQMQRLPYTAEFKTTRVQTLADGSTITHESTEVIARDLQGRTFRLSASPSEGPDQTIHTSVTIDDPTAKTQTSWFVPGQRVTVINQIVPGARCGVNASAPGLQAAEEKQVEPVREDLGKQTFQGIEAHGNRTTRSYPEGVVGNSAPLVASFEVWISSSPGLSGINVHQVSDDPRTGKTTREMVRFTQGEPDLTMFQQPEGLETATQETHVEVRCP